MLALSKLYIFLFGGFATSFLITYCFSYLPKADNELIQVQCEKVLDEMLDVISIFKDLNCLHFRELWSSPMLSFLTLQ